MQNILSITFVPVFSSGKLCGALGVDDCTNERKWRKEEVAALRIASCIIGVLCHKDQVTTV